MLPWHGSKRRLQSPPEDAQRPQCCGGGNFGGMRPVWKRRMIGPKFSLINKLCALDSYTLVGGQNVGALPIERIVAVG